MLNQYPPGSSSETLPNPSEGRARQRIALSEIRNPMTRKAHEVWERLRGARPYPRREELPLRELRELLRHSVLLRALDGGADFEVRVVGDAIVVGLGRSFQGATLKEVDKVIPGYGAALLKTYRYVISTGEPAAFRGWYDREPGKRAYYQESVLLPLGPETGADHLFAVVVYAHSDGAV